jgi:hypothetical protein
MADRRAIPIPRSALVLFLASAVIVQSAAPAWAWGRLGHRVIAKLAERHLTDRAKAEIRALLEPGESLADCSTWADENGLRIRGSGAWHHANVPLNEPRYYDKFVGTGPGHGQIVPKISELQAILKDRSRPVMERRQALRSLVHLDEDLSQPLHVGDNHNRGGDALQLRFFRRGTNFHHLWDTLLVEHWSRDEEH